MTNNRDRIYLDNSASTAVDVRVLKEMEPYWRDKIGNAGSLHQEGQEAKQAVEHARESIAKSLGTQKRSIIFTSGGTESNNMAVFGTVQRAIELGKRPQDIEVITSNIEHSSVLDCFSVLEHMGIQVLRVSNNEEGLVSIEELKSLINEKTLLISIVYVNNEIGTVQDVHSIKRAIREAKEKKGEGAYPLLHYDASQASVWLPLNVENLSVDLLTLDSQKIYGPKGIGCLFVREHENIEQILYGGRQEMGLRPGTPPTPLIVGFAKALEILEKERHMYLEECKTLQAWFLDRVEKEIERVTVNGPKPGERRTAGNISLSLEDIDAERLVLELDAQGIACSTGSACFVEGKRGHIIRALGKEKSNTTNTVRFTFSRDVKKIELEKVLHVLTDTVKRIRAEH